MNTVYFNPKVSVIIATYNQENKIEKCLLSILHQSYTNLEIIIVDDGSFDNTSFICKKYMTLDKRIKYIYQKNGGLSKARNTGLINITGEYITFVDSDDYIEPDLIFYYISYLKKYKNYICISGYRIIKEDRIIQEYRKNFTILSNKQGLEILFYDDARSYKNFMWNKIYPSSFFENIKFEENKVFEDIRIQYKLFELSEKIIICPYVGYNYIYTENSISNTKKNILQFIDAQIDRIKYIHKKGYMNYLPLLSNKLFNDYIVRCNRFYLKKINAQEEKNIICYDISYLKDIFRSNLSNLKYLIFLVSLKNNILIDLLIYLLWNLNLKIKNLCFKTKTLIIPSNLKNRE